MSSFGGHDTKSEENHVLTFVKNLNNQYFVKEYQPLMSGVGHDIKSEKNTK